MCRVLRSLPHVTLLAGALAVASGLSACRDVPPPEARPDAPSATPGAVATASTVPGSRERAQRIVDAAAQRLVVDGSARYTMTWRTGPEPGEKLDVGWGGFDLGGPVAYQVLGVDGAEIETRLTVGHAWTRIGMEGQPPALGGCWVHLARGTGDEAIAAAIPPPAQMLIAPVAVGLLAEPADDGVQQVAVEVRLDEAAPAVMPRVVNGLAGELDPGATVPAVLTVRDGRYVALEYRLGAVLDAFEPDDIPAQLEALGGSAEELDVRFEYGSHGAEVAVRPPPAREVVDGGDQADLLAGGADATAGLTPCAGALSGP